jgi:subtilase family serine protease
MTRLMAPRHPQTRWSVSASAARRRACAALVLAAALCAFAAPSSALASSTLARTTNALTGLGNSAQLTARSVCEPATATRATCYAQMLVNSTTGAPVHPGLANATPTAGRFANARSAAAGGSQPQPGSPAYMQQAYDLSYLSQTRGAGDTIAIVDAYNNPNAETDLATYRASFGLPACTTANGCFRKVDQNGGQSFPPQGPGWNSEISLDLDAVSALCPRCNIVLVEANSNGGSDLVAAQAEAAALGANQITDSWGSPTSYVAPGPYAFPGVATVAAAGDGGYAGVLSNQMPAALPNVTAAGGTALIPASASGIVNARGFTEQGWSGAGSGCDVQISKPAWQADTGCSGRSYSDLSANANPDTGLAVYDSADGGWLLMGGTSESAPLIAAYYAITGASAATPAWAYQHSSQLNDPTGQSNGSCAVAILFICLAGPGYDGPTGTGSISGAVTPGAPGIGGPGPDGTYTRSTGATSVQLQAGIYPNSSDTIYSWQYGTTAGYGQGTATADAGSGQAPVTVSSTLPGLAPRTTYHYRLVAQNAYGTMYGYDSVLTTTATSAPRVSAVKATLTGQRTAKLKATVDVQGGTATYHFVYGTGNRYRNRTAPAPLSGGSGTPVAATLTGLSPHTTYQVKLVASSAGGSAESPVKTFTTGAHTRLGGRRRGPRHPARHH